MPWSAVFPMGLKPDPQLYSYVFGCEFSEMQKFSGFFVVVVFFVFFVQARPAP